MHDDSFMPNPWRMGVVIIGAGVVLWWLTPDMARHEEDFPRSTWGRVPALRSWPRRIGTYHFHAGRLGAVLCILLGVAILLAAVRVV